MAFERSSRARALRLAAAALALLPAAVLAAAPAQAQSGAALHAGTLEVPVNKSQVVSTDRPIARAMIGNDKIADVLPITDRSVYVLGKMKGTTSLTLYDSLGRVISVMDVAVGPDVEALNAQMRDLIPGETILARISNESVVLSGTVNSAGAADRAFQLAKAYADDKVINLIGMGSSQQVMLEVRFAEVTRTTNKDIGVRSSIATRDGTLNALSGVGSTFAPGVTGTSTTNQTNSTNSSSNNANLNRTGSNGTFNNNLNTGTNFSNNGTTNSTSNINSNSNIVTSDRGLDGITPPFSGSVSDFTNLNTLNGKTFTGSGFAGAEGVTNSTTIGTTTSGTTGATGSGTTSSNESGGSSVLGSVGSLATAIGSSALGTIASTTTSLSSLFQLGSIGQGFGIFSKQFGIGNVAIQTVLDAMESRGLAKTLAQPTLVALSGEKASFLAGGEFPVPVAQSGAGSTNGFTAITVEFKPFGVSLAFTPTVLGDKTISLIVEPEVSQIDPGASITIGNITIPGLRTRRASTTLQLRDGESFAIAGLLSRDFQTTVRQVPLLGSIPILGALFRSSSFQKGETELLIVVTPRLVAPLRPEQVRLPTDGVKDPSVVGTVLFGQPYVPQKLAPVAPRTERPVSNATPLAPSAPQAAAELPAKGGDYAY